jgi:hypothetical protein
MHHSILNLTKHTQGMKATNFIQDGKKNMILSSQSVGPLSLEIFHRRHFTNHYKKVHVHA